MNIVSDTNVLISGVLSGGHAREILQLASHGVLINFISPDILREAERVLGRSKRHFGQRPRLKEGDSIWMVIFKPVLSEVAGNILSSLLIFFLRGNAR